MAGMTPSAVILVEKIPGIDRIGDRVRGLPVDETEGSSRGQSRGLERHDSRVLRQAQIEAARVVSFLNAHGHDGQTVELVGVDPESVAPRLGFEVAQ